MTSTVNYIIACSGHRAGKIDSSGMLGKDVLKKHLQQLALMNLSALTQITIVRALPLERNSESSSYWDITEELNTIKTPVEILDVEDQYFSYSSWIHAMLYCRKKFDYYILIEDDYYPSLPNFVEELIRIHKEKLPTGGYLNGFTTDIAAVSNGICDSKTASECLNRNSIRNLAPGAQTLFGKIAFNNKLADYTDQYRTLFWGGPGMVDETHNPDVKLTVDLIRPIQYLILGEQIFYEFRS